eukprot:3141053-Amphidinium_carterae.1
MQRLLQDYLGLFSSFVVGWLPLEWPVFCGPGSSSQSCRDSRSLVTRAAAGYFALPCLLC